MVPIKGSTVHIGKDAGADTARRMAATQTAEQAGRHPCTLHPNVSVVTKPATGNGHLMAPTGMVT
jgi:hypothetical protein